MADFYPADVGREIVASGGLGIITGYTNATTVTVEIKQAFPATLFGSGEWLIMGSPMASCTPSAKDPVGTSVTLTLSLAGWRTTDVGSYVRINGGLCKITSISSDTIANATIQTELTSNVAAPALAWTLERSAWGGPYGWPRCGTMYEQRLWLAGSPAFPQGMWGSVIGVPLDFTIGSLDDEGISYVIASGEANPILHLANARGLLALTTGGEFSVRGGQDKPITPTNLQVKDQSNYGSAQVPPVRAGKEIMVVQRGGRKLRALSPNDYDDGQYVAPDLSVLAEHITKPGLVSMTYQPDDDAVLYAARSDGLLASLTIDRDQEVFAWSRQSTQGNFESIEAVPNEESTRVFAIVARPINGVMTRYVEMFEPGLHTDSAITGFSEAGATVWGGLTHLAGRVVQAKGDGIYIGAFPVSQAGEITLTRSANELEVGLAYNTQVLTLTPEFMGPSGSSQGHQLSAHEIKVRLHETVGCTINLQQVAFRELGLEVLDKQPALYSGDKLAGNIGWGNGLNQTLVQQTLPYDFHLLSVITKMTANEG